MTDLVAIDPAHDWYAEVPRSIRKHAILGIALMAAAFGSFGYWSFTAPLAAAVIAQGSFVATGRNKIVQHLEGGIIEEIYVQEGQHVDKGDSILSLDRTAAETGERELYLREMRLQATSERLLAEYREAEKLDFSANLLEAARTDLEIASILDGQQLTFDITRKSLMNDIALLERNIEALRIRADGYTGQLASFALRSDILKEDIEDKGKLLDSGLVRKSELNALRRMQAEADGQLARLQAEADEVQQMILKHQSQIDRARSSYRETALDELGPIAADLESVREKLREARSVLSRSIVRSPVSGTIVRMYYHTPKGVIETGKPIAEILPADAPLIIETQVARTEIDSVIVGQHATVRLTALNRRTTPVLNGEVFYISADSLPEQVSGIPQEVYLARVSVAPEEIKHVRGFVPTPGMPVEVMIQTQERTFADGFVPTPGMPVEVMIQTQERTFADYLTKPITDSFQRAFREQ